MFDDVEGEEVSQVMHFAAYEGNDNQINNTLNIYGNALKDLYQVVDQLKKEINDINLDKYLEINVWKTEKQKIENHFNQQISNLKKEIDDLKKQLQSQKADFSKLLKDQEKIFNDKLSNLPQTYDNPVDEEDIFNRGKSELQVLLNDLEPPVMATNIFNISQEHIISFLQQTYTFNLKKHMIEKKYTDLHNKFSHKDLSKFQNIKAISPLKETMYALIDTINRQLQYQNKNTAISFEAIKKIEEFLQQHDNECGLEAIMKSSNATNNNKIPYSVIQKQANYAMELLDDIFNVPVLEFPDNQALEAKRNYNQHNEQCYNGEYDEISEILAQYDKEYKTTNTGIDLLDEEQRTIESCYDRNIYTNQYTDQLKLLYEDEEMDDVKSDIRYNMNYLYPGNTIDI